MTAATRRYRRVLAVPHVLSLSFAGALGRAPLGIDGIAVLLFVREERGSYALAGAVAGALALGTGVAAPFQGRLIDRLGQPRVLVPCGLLHATALAALVALTFAGAPAAALVAVGVLTGATLPPISAAMRTLWPVLLERERALLPAAFALDSVLTELAFVTGPLLTALAVAIASPAAAIGFAAVAVIVGTLWFAASPASRAWHGGERANASRLGPLASVGMRTLLIGMLPVGAGFGAIEVALAAFGRDHGSATVSGLLLAVFSASSAAGGLIYGARTRGGPVARRYLLLVLVQPFTLALLPLGDAVAVMILLAVPSGLAIAPLIAAANELVAEVAPAGTLTEAFTWVVMAMVLGTAAGNALAGAIVEDHSWRTALIAAALFAAVSAAVVLVRRDTLTAAPAGAAAV